MIQRACRLARRGEKGALPIQARVKVMDVINQSSEQAVAMPEPYRIDKCYVEYNESMGILLFTNSALCGRQRRERPQSILVFDSRHRRWSICMDRV